MVNLQSVRNTFLQNIAHNDDQPHNDYFKVLHVYAVKDFVSMYVSLYVSD